MWSRDKTNKQQQQKPTKKTLDETNVSTMRLRCYCCAKDRKPDAEMQFGANLCHWVDTCEKSPTHKPLNSASFVCRAVDSARCIGVFCTSAGQESDPTWMWNELPWGRNLALSQNTNNNPSMFLIRFAFYIDVHCVSAGDYRRDISLLLFLGGLFTVAASHAGPEHTRSSCLVLFLTVFQVWSARCGVGVSLGRCY